MGDDNFSMLGLLRGEVETQGGMLQKALDCLKAGEESKDSYEEAYRAVHSLKGAAKLVGISSIYTLSDKMSSLFQTLMNDGGDLSKDVIDLLENTLKKIREIANLDDDTIKTFDVNQDDFRELQTKIDEISIAPSNLENGNLSQLKQPAKAIDSSMLTMFREEVENHGGGISDCLLKLEDDPANDIILEKLMRAAHSIKGAAKLVGVEAVVRLSHVMEDLFVASQNKQITLSNNAIDKLLETNDLIGEIAALDDDVISQWESDNESLLSNYLKELDSILKGEPKVEGSPENSKPSGEVKKSQVDASMLEMFRDEVANHGGVMADCLIKLEENPADSVIQEKLMRAAHSVKGAAKLVGVDAIVSLAHLMEDVFVAAQKGLLVLEPKSVDVLLTTNDEICKIALLDEEAMSAWSIEHQMFLQGQLATLSAILHGESIADNKPVIMPEVDIKPVVRKVDVENEANKSQRKSAGSKGDKRVLKVTADRWDSMMGLAGEIKVEAGWLVPYLQNMVLMRKKQHEMSSLVNSIRDYVSTEFGDRSLQERIIEVHNKLTEFHSAINDQMSNLDQYERRITHLTDRLHREALSTRMRPFSDGVHGFQRMVRDISRSINKRVKLEIRGEATQVDREVLEKMEAPLNHIIRNGLDHGIETPEERAALGKSEIATITLSAMHNEGMLMITVEDDGRGIDVEMIREKIVRKGLSTEAMAENLSREELLEFLFLPSFSTRDQVTDLSGRGVGLDVVMDAIQSMRGRVKIETELNVGTKFLMRLPLTLSVVPGLLVKISHDYYAFPLSRIVCTAKVDIAEVEVVEGHQYAIINGENVGLVAASHILELEQGSQIHNDYLSIIVITNYDHTYGVVVDEFVDQRELAVQSIDSRLEKVQDISSCALLEDGSTVMIIDVEDMVRTIDQFVKGGRISNLEVVGNEDANGSGKRVLVVDDSPTVREVEKKLLEDAGYKVDIAVDGMDGWNAVRAKNYDLVITDIDMPRMNGIELVSMIKDNSQYHHLPVIIVSYKDRVEDRQQGMDVGADYYLTKGSFHDDSFICAVHDLIGEATL